MSLRKTTGIGLAVAAASLFATAPVYAEGGGAAEEAQVHCYGVNECAGHNDCKTAKNACKGQAACKGQGFQAITQEECDAKGGTVGP